MVWIALTCPQCGAPLPRVALWRPVKCGACGALITKVESLVTRDAFRQALKRAGLYAAGLTVMECGGVRYQLLQVLGTGEISHVHLARRIGSLPLLTTIKLSSAPAAVSLYSHEAEVSRELQLLDLDGFGPYFSRLLPEVIAQGATDRNHGEQALVMRHPTGFWGSMASLNERFATGLDPRHAVWIWRRMLEAMNFIHNQGWCHGDVRPEHTLVDPQAHGVRFIGWSSAKKNAGEKDKAADLCRSARVVQILLCGAGGPDLPGNMPAGLAQLVMRAATDEDFCGSQSAEGLDALLQAEAKAAFGPPSYVPLTI